MGEGDDGVVVDAGHGFGGDHGVDDGFFGGLTVARKSGIEFVVRQHFEVADSLGRGGAGIGGGEGDEDVSGAVAGVAAVAAEAERGAAGEALELRGNQRGVGGDDDDDGAGVYWLRS